MAHSSKLFEVECGFGKSSDDSELNPETVEALQELHLEPFVATMNGPLIDVPIGPPPSSPPPSPSPLSPPSTPSSPLSPPSLQPSPPSPTRVLHHFSYGAASPVLYVPIVQTFSDTNTSFSPHVANTLPPQPFLGGTTLPQFPPPPHVPPPPQFLYGTAYSTAFSNVQPISYAPLAPYASSIANTHPIGLPSGTLPQFAPPPPHVLPPQLLYGSAYQTVSNVAPAVQPSSATYAPIGPYTASIAAIISSPPALPSYNNSTPSSNFVAAPSVSASTRTARVARVKDYASLDNTSKFNRRFSQWKKLNPLLQGKWRRYRRANQHQCHDDRCIRLKLAFCRFHGGELAELASEFRGLGTHTTCNHEPVVM